MAEWICCSILNLYSVKNPTVIISIVVEVSQTSDATYKSSTEKAPSRPGMDNLWQYFYFIKAGDFTVNPGQVGHGSLLR